MVVVADLHPTLVGGGTIHQTNVSVSTSHIRGCSQQNFLSYPYIWKLLAPSIIPIHLEVACTVYHTHTFGSCLHRLSYPYIWKLLAPSTIPIHLEVVYHTHTFGSCLHRLSYPYIWKLLAPSIIPIHLEVACTVYHTHTFGSCLHRLSYPYIWKLHVIFMASTSYKGAPLLHCSTVETTGV